MLRAICVSSRVVVFVAVITAFVLTVTSVASAQHIHLRSQLTPNCTSTAGANLKFADIFGDGNIAVQGSYGCKGAFIYDITNPDAPVLASWYNPGNNIQFLEAVVIGNRGYFGSGNGGGGIGPRLPMLGARPWCSSRRAPAPCRSPRSIRSRWRAGSRSASAWPMRGR